MMITSPCFDASARHFSAHFAISLNMFWMCNGKSLKFSTCHLSTNDEGQMVSSQSNTITVSRFNSMRVMVVVIVVVVVAVLVLDFAAFHEFLDFELFSIVIVLDTVVQAKFLKTFILAYLIVVGVVAVAIFLRSFTGLLSGFLLLFDVSLDELFHGGNVLACVLTCGLAVFTGVAGTELILDETLSHQRSTAFFTVSLFGVVLGDFVTSFELETVASQPQHIILIVIQSTGLFQKARTGFGIGADRRTVGDRKGRQEQGKRKFHFNIVTMFETMSCLNWD
mmetsp:Transcript_8136/g.12477  ORF Transcript_8136/g.12477 Transcript_8136/m.12477 type:complete len:280 (-) Transcript_8136:13-852(-)